MKQIKYFLVFALLLTSCGSPKAPTAGPAADNSAPAAAEAGAAETAPAPAAESAPPTPEKAAAIAAGANEFLAFYDGTSGNIGQRAKDALGWLAASDLADDEEKCALYSGAAALLFRHLKEGECPAEDLAKLRYIYLDLAEMATQAALACRNDSAAICSSRGLSNCLSAADTKSAPAYAVYFLTLSEVYALTGYSVMPVLADELSLAAAALKAVDRSYKVLILDFYSAEKAPHIFPALRERIFTNWQ